MLSWLKRKIAGDAAVSDLIKTAKRVAWLRASIISLGVTEAEESDAFVSEGALALLRAVTKRTKVKVSEDDTDFVDGVMLMVFCNHFSHVLHRSFEFSSSLALVTYYGYDQTDKVAYAITSYNQMTLERSQTIEAIGNLCVGWGWKPDEERLNSIADLRGMLLMEASKT